MKCALKEEPPGKRQARVPRKGVHDEEQWQQVQSGVQILGGAGGPEGRRESGRSPGGKDWGVHQVTLANWKRHFLEHGAEAFGKKEVKTWVCSLTMNSSPTPVLVFNELI